MTLFRSCIYVGEVVHQRFAPRKHRLRYPMFQILFDLDETDEMGRSLRLFSHNRFNAFSFHDADHGDGAGSGLRPYVERLLAEAQVQTGGGRIELLCMPRVLGYVFNPLSVYYCRDASDSLVAMIYEVNNTFGERHSYVIPVSMLTDGVVRQSCEKIFFVSPFMSMDMAYEFSMTPPDERIATVVNSRDRAGSLMIHAAFSGERRPMTDSALIRAFLAYPFLTVGAVVAIHWEALKLFLKGIGLRQRPAPPENAATIVSHRG